MIYLNPTISIIVPVYNTEKYLQRCLESIAAQTYKDFECILVDDGSTDGSDKICDEYAAKDNRFKVFHKKNGGVSSARNIGIAHANGEWLYFCDSDDKLHDGESLTNLFKLANDADMAVGSYIAPDDNGKDVTDTLESIKPFVGILSGKEYISEHMEPKLHIGYIGFLWNKLFRRDIIEKNKLRFEADIKYAEDLLFITQYVCSSDCHKIAIDNNLKIYEYYQYSGSAMANIRRHYNTAFFTDFIAYERIVDVIHNSYHDKALDIVTQNKLCMQGLWHLDMMEHSQYIDLSQWKYIESKIKCLKGYNKIITIYSLGKMKENALSLPINERVVVTNKYLHSKDCHYTYLNYKWKLAWLLSHIAGKRGLNLIKNQMNFNSSNK